MIRIGFLTAVCLVAAPLAQGAEEETVEIRQYEVRVDDRPVGVHSLKIRERDGRTSVSMRSDITVQILLFRYSHVFDAKELWDGQTLVAFDARTNANGKKSRLRLKRSPDRTLVQFQDRVTRVEHPQQTNTYSRLPAGVRDKQTVRLLNVDEGVTVNTTWHSIEDAEFQIANGVVACRKWVVNGGLDAELWFDDTGWLVRQQTIEQGHPTELLLTSIQHERVQQ